MKAIWKYTLEPGHTQLDIPAGGQVLSAQVQHGELRIWVLVDPSEPLVVREFSVYGTGHKVPDDPGYLKAFIGTVQMAGGSLIFHVFETASGK